MDDDLVILDHIGSEYEKKLNLLAQLNVAADHEIGNLIMERNTARKERDDLDTSYTNVVIELRRQLELERLRADDAVIHANDAVVRANEANNLCHDTEQSQLKTLQYQYEDSIANCDTLKQQLISLQQDNQYLQ